MLAYLGWALSKIGWLEVWRALPDQPLFYLLAAPLFFALPIADWLSYRLIWGSRVVARALPVFVRKRVYNQGFIGYSGEAYLVWWGARHGGLSAGAALAQVKDVSVLGATAGNIFTAALALSYPLSRGWLAPNAALLLAAGLFMLVIVLASALLRKRLISIPGPVMRRVMLVQLVRVVVTLSLQVAQWAAALPQTPLSSWILLLTVQMVVSRVPFIPNRELAAVGAALAVAGSVNAPQEAVASMLLAAGALMQALNFAAFLATSVGAYKPEAAPPPQENAAPAAPAAAREAPTSQTADT
jgi:hypothetical protein